MQLVRYEEAKRAIAEYKTVDEVKDFRDKTVAIEAYAKQANDFELEKDAAIARVRAERKCGELLLDMEKGTKTSKPNEVISPFREACDAAGINKDQSSQWQKLANVPEKEFEEGMQRCRQSGTKPTARALIPNKKKPAARMNPHALYWWGELNSFINDGRFNLSLTEVIEEMTPAMRADFIGNLPKLKKWLEN